MRPGRGSSFVAPVSNLVGTDLSRTFAWMVTRRILGIWRRDAGGGQGPARCSCPSPAGSTVEPSIFDRIEMCKRIRRGARRLVGDGPIQRLKTMASGAKVVPHGVSGSDARHLMSLVQLEPTPSTRWSWCNQRPSLQAQAGRGRRLCPPPFPPASQF